MSSASCPGIGFARCATGRLCLAAVGVALVVLSGCGAQKTGGADAPGKDQPDGIAAAARSGDPMASVVMEKCTSCHDLSRIEAKKTDRDGWASTIASMRGRGAQLTDSEASDVVNYLAGRTR